MRHRLLAAILALTAPLSAQTCFFSGGTAWVKGSPLLLCDWNGKPAFLLLCPGGDHFVNMGSAYYQKPDLYTFTVEAVYIYDPRPCAPGSRVAINCDDNWMLWPYLGFMGRDGVFSAMNLSMPITLSRSAPSFTVQQYEVDYCEGLGGCYSNCGSLYPFPLWSAIVMTVK